MTPHEGISPKNVWHSEVNSVQSDTLAQIAAGVFWGGSKWALGKSYMELVSTSLIATTECLFSR